MMIHLTCWTRPEIAFTVSSLAKYADPSKCRWTHVQAIARVVRYLKSTSHLGLRYQGSASGKANLVAWVDADHAGNASTRLSVSGFVVMARGAAIQWMSGRQRLVAQSSFESELIASRDVSAEMLEIRKDYRAIEQVDQPLLFRVGCDNAAVIAVSQGAGKYSNRKFIEIRYFLIRRTVEQGVIVLATVGTDWNVADLFTKALGTEMFVKFRDMVLNTPGAQDDDDTAQWLQATTQTMETMATVGGHVVKRE